MLDRQKTIYVHYTASVSLLHLQKATLGYDCALVMVYPWYLADGDAQLKFDKWRNELVNALSASEMPGVLDRETQCPVQKLRLT